VRSLEERLPLSWVSSTDYASEEACPRATDGYDGRRYRAREGGPIAPVDLSAGAEERHVPVAVKRWAGGDDPRTAIIPQAAPQVLAERPVVRNELVDGYGKILQNVLTPSVDEIRRWVTAGPDWHAELVKFTLRP
jgi:hypothetical protein